MSAEGFIAAAVMLALGVSYLTWPLLRRRFSVTGEEVTRRKQRDELLTTYERTLATIRDLDEDHLTGKLSEDDYQAERGYWKEQGVAVLQALDVTGGERPAKLPSSARAARTPLVTEPDPDAILDDAIEQAIENYLKSTH